MKENGQRWVYLFANKIICDNIKRGIGGIFMKSYRILITSDMHYTMVDSDVILDEEAVHFNRWVNERIEYQLG